MRKLIIGITGTFGSGKTTVAKMLEKRGAVLINVDKLARRVAKNKRVKKKILREFGTADRKKLAEIVFSDKSKLTRLNGIIHPEVKKEAKKLILSLKGRFIAVDAPLLIEARFLDLIGCLIVVVCNDKARSRRLLQKGFGKHETEARTGFQMPDSKKIKYADFVIDNSKTKEETEKQVERAWRNITSRR